MTRRIRYIFFGTPNFAAKLLDVLLRKNFLPEAVVCNPDRPAGKKRAITPPAVKTLVQNFDSSIKVFQPEKLSEIKDSLDELEADIFLVAAYAKIIPAQILTMAKMAPIGAHPSLLPKYRGATPIQSVILAGEKTTGATLYKMDEKVDRGPIVLQEELTLAEDETYGSLEDKLASLCAKMTLRFFEDAQNLIKNAKDQDHAKATYTKKFETKDALVDVTEDSAESIYRKIRALNPEPGVFTFNFKGREGKRVKLLEAKMENGTLRVLKIQQEGRRPVSL